MTTVLRFTGPDGKGDLMSTYVAEAPDQVYESWTAADGLPFKLTHEESGRTIYVNPQNVACWFEQPSQAGS